MIMNTSRNVEIMGYSERGIVSSLMYEMTTAENSLELFRNFLNLYTPMCGEQRPDVGDLERVIVLLEHSFSDFGDADIVFYLETHKGTNHCVYVEAKVSNGVANWDLSKQLAWFLAHAKRTGDVKQDPAFSSNLFSQLYHKKRLTDTLRLENWKEKLSAGVIFPVSSTKRERKIGNNPVVGKATESLQKWIIKSNNNVWYLALVPQGFPDGDLASQLNDVPSDYDGWDVSHYGCVCWPNVKEFCESTRLRQTLAVFEHNEELIFSKLERQGQES